MNLPQIINTISPRKLLLVDSIGALVSAFFLGIVLVKWQTFIGMPTTILYGLALIACIFAVYSFVSYKYLAGDSKPYLKIIAIANLLYGCLTMGLVIYFYPQLSKLGILYFVGELLIIISLVIVELKTAAKVL